MHTLNLEPNRGLHRRRLVRMIAGLTVAAATLVAASCGSDDDAAPATAAPATAAASSDAPIAVGSTTTEAPTTTAESTTTAAPTTTAEPIATAPFPTETSTETFVDPSRPTAATSASPELPERTVTTLFVRPSAPGPFPLIVLSHGYLSHPRYLSRVATAWATAGYVVAMPVHPLTNVDEPTAGENFGDVFQQPADISFVIDMVLELNSDSSSDLFEQIDPDRIGAAGLSMGGATTYPLVHNECCRDERISAAVIMAGFDVTAPETNDFSQSIPMLLLHGEADEVVVIQTARDIYANLTGPKWFVTLLGASHSEAFEPAPEDAVSVWDTIVDTSTVDFWNGTLGGDPSQLEALATDAVSPGLSTLESSP